MSSINFANPWLLLIAIPLLAAFVVPFAVAVRSDNRNGHNITSMALHIVMALLIAFSVAGTSVQTTVTETSVYVVADVSYSASKNLDAVDGYIKALSDNLPRNSKMGVVCFGKNYQLLTSLGGRFTSVKNATVDEGETDICGALEYTGNLFKEDVLKHIVLITDGCDSDRRDANVLTRTVNDLALKDIKVDAIYLDDNLDAEAYEVQLSNAEFTANAFVGKSESVTCIIQCNRAVNGQVTLYKEGEASETKNEQFNSGYNPVTFNLDTTTAGSFEYKLEVAAEQDGSDYNNVYTFVQNVTDEINVLFITGESSDAQTARDLFGQNANLDIYDLNKTKAVPYSVEQLCAYDEIYLSNADVYLADNATAFVTNLDIAVSLFGKHLVTIGDTNIQNAATSEDSVQKQVYEDLGNMLPVKFGNNAGDPKLFTIVIDDSRSMKNLGNLNIAKTASQHLIELLGEDDYLCLVAFDSDVRLLLSPMRIGGIYDFNNDKTVREHALEIVENLQLRQGTVIGAGLREAYRLMANMTSFGDRQVMLISDGLNYTEDRDDPVQIATNLKVLGITTSVIDVGRGADNGAEATEAKNLLAQIASIGGGELYEAKNDVNNLKNVIFAEMANSVTATRVNTNAWINIARRFDESVSGYDAEAKYFVTGGYMLGKTDQRGGVTTVLTLDYVPENSTIPITAPLYAYRKYGNGTVASYTGIKLGSGITVQKDGENIGKFDGTFFGNVFKAEIPEEKTTAPFTVETNIEGKYASFVITPPEIMSNAQATVSVTLPDGTVLEPALCTFKTTCFGYDLALPSSGRYQVTLTYTYGGNSYSTDASFNLDYLDEYDLFRTYDTSVLYKMLGGNGTVSTDGTLKIENDPKDVTLYTVSLVVPMLVFAAVLWVVDIVVRKLKWIDVKSFFTIKKKGGGKS